ncbi:hypothetical protein HBI06_111210 [Parastagonospora nodorum]|nr:hypothetical protein HBI06_111210 [Parastagonospora nodorum]KAH4247434.1 hypothetical protein HBI05_045240 [Parastagonospora nodorum]
MPNGNVVTIRTTTGIVQDCLLTEARPQPKKAHSIVSKAYALLELTAEEEQTMIDWSLMPKRLNRIWWAAYESYKEAAEKDPAALETWGERMKAAHQVSVEENVVERQ